MFAAGGAGLAAPQIGVGLRVFTWYVDGEVGHLVNPDVTPVGEETEEGPEGCLSIPGFRWDCRRHLHVVGHRLEHARRPGAHRGLASCWPAPSSTRPTTSTASCSSTGSTPGPAPPRSPSSRPPSGPAWPSTCRCPSRS